MAKRITDKLMRELQPPPPRPHRKTGKIRPHNEIIYDTKIKGFGVRITSGGAKSFILNYRNAEGRDRRITIGTYQDPWSVEAARKRATTLKKKVSLGEDPLADRIKTRTAPTITDLCARYVEDYLPRKRASSQASDRRIIARIIKPKLGVRKVASIVYADVDGLHRSLKATPYQANRVLALLSKMFSLAIRWGWRTDNPCRGVDRYQEEKRKRYLSTEEIGRLTKALDDHADQRPADVVRLCLLTGCRMGEALSATWDQLDLDAGKWVKPGATTMNHDNFQDIYI